MIGLAPNEELLLTIRRHWIVFLGPTAVFLVALLVPPVALLIAPTYLPAIGRAPIRPIANFFLALYLMGVVTFLLVRWLDYYLDVWVITDHRIIDIEQHGLFRREVSEISLERIQNVTVEIPGFLATLLGFGNIKIKTAGEGEFTIAGVVSPAAAKDVILQHSRRAHQAAQLEP